MYNNKQKGSFGEKAAAEHLIEKGYKILETNYRIRTAEIDIIAEKDGIIAFVEVKLRRNANMGAPCEAVNTAKQKKIITAAESYIAENGINNNDFRFDVLEVTADKDVIINHIENAFWS